MERESSLGGRLRRLMEEEGLSYEQLGERLGMNPQTLNRYVLGQREPKIGTASAMAAALGVDPLWLLGYDVPRRTGQRQSVPILGTIRAGLPMAAEQRGEGWATADVAEPEEHFFLRVTTPVSGTGIWCCCGGRIRRRTARLWPVWWTGRTPPSSASAASGTWCSSSRRTPPTSPS